MSSSLPAVRPALAAPPHTETGLEQQVPMMTVGASYGAAFLAAQAVGGPTPRHQDRESRA